MGVLSYWYQKTAYIIVHQGSLWIILSFVIAGIILWPIMSAEADEKEANFARKGVQIYFTLAVATLILGAVLS